ncbi:MAG TPA: heparinase II/III family protein, partial [bacterium]
SENSISPKTIPSELNLLQNLKPGNPDLKQIYQMRNAGKADQAIQLLVEYLKQKSADCYYFDWKHFKQRFKQYRSQYPEQRQDHFDLANEQMTTYPPETNWILPFKNLKGDEVTAYELRHLARQQKSFDMALMFYYLDEDDKYLDYWVRQVADLNQAFSEAAYDDAGNGIYESFRAGKRIHNWLFCHHAYFVSEKYTWQSQLLLIKTFLHHGARLQKETQKYRSGNHHTKGLVALFEIAVMFSDFEISDSWKNQALSGLAQHLQNEVNDDGFQFERSVHYHIGDIENYFRVYQAAKLNNVALPENFEIQFRKMFDALSQLAQPNKKLPVLQDGTDSPFAENNQIDDVMTVGTLIFGDPVLRYFSTDEIPADIYWLLRPEQFENIYNVKGANQILVLWR